MNRLFKIIAIIVSSVIILVVSIFFFSKFSKVTESNKKITLTSNNIQDGIEIIYNKIGIPHIYANNEGDLFFGIGYVHAENRLWQMDFYKRASLGRLSEVLGPKYLLVDKFMRGLNINKISNQIWNMMDVQTKIVLENYANGINYYLEQNSDNLPLEYSILDYNPEKWEPKDCILIQRFLSLQMSSSVLTDLIFSSISNKLGPDLTKQLLPTFDSSKKYSIINSKINANFFRTDTTENSQLISELENTLNKLGIDNFSGGSNAWAIRKGNSNYSRATLASDLHLNLTIPSIMFQIQAVSDNFHYTGFTVPGIPFAVVGRNDSISWAYTNLMNDAFDYFSETISKNGKDYLAEDSTYKPLKFKIDTIGIKDSNPHRYYQRYADKSIIISDFHIYNSKNNFLRKKHSGKFGSKNLTFRWIGSTPSDELTALYQINKARNWDEFLGATSKWSNPGVIYNYADTKGNIGIRPCASIPIRGKNNVPWLINSSSDKNTDWKLLLTTNELKSKFNPPQNFVASANTYYSDTLAPYVSYLFDNHSRIHRINDFLFKLKDYELRDMKNMQLDIYSRYAYEMLQIILPVLNESQDFLNLKEKTALRKLKNWDCMMTGNKTAPTIFNSLVLNLIYKTFHDELGDELFLDYTYNSTFSYNRILELLQSNSTLFFDNKNTKTIENSRYIIFQSFRDALTYIEEYSGKIETEDWFWVNFHKVILMHPHGENKHLRSIYSTTPIGIGGNWSTINYSNWEFRKPFTVKSGAAIRFISDMRDDAIYCIMPGGISGDPTNIHFSNQLRIWANGGYFKLIHSHKKINSSNSRNIIPE